MFDSLEWFYKDYGKSWFTSLSKAKKYLLQSYKDEIGGKFKIVTVNEGEIWEVQYDDYV
jgi:hypothetical protein